MRVAIMFEPSMAMVWLGWSLPSLYWRVSGQDLDFLRWLGRRFDCPHPLKYSLIIHEGSPCHNAHAVDFLAHDLVGESMSLRSL